MERVQPIASGKFSYLDKLMASHKKTTYYKMWWEIILETDE